MTNDDTSTHHLDIIHDPTHWSYKVPGLLAWSFLSLGILGTIFFPRYYLVFARIFALYLVSRFVIDASFFLLGVIRLQRRSGAGEKPFPIGNDPLYRQVHHVVVVPNYKEPLPLLRRTLQALAAQEEAQRRLTVVLAMEAAEPGAWEKGTALRAEFADKFACVLVTVHPANRPGEVTGKGANQAWAARHARRVLVDERGMPLEAMTITSCDADAMLPPGYFSELAHRFVRDPQRHTCFWQAPLFYHNNVWQVPAPIRFLAFFLSSVQLGQLANPIAFPFPLSTYSLSLKLADTVGYWDPAVVGEDWHMYLRCFFATGGQVRLDPIFLPITADAVGGDTWWQVLVNNYRQRERHAWGAKDVGYILQQWRHREGLPWYKVLFRLMQALHEHLMLSTAWFIFAFGGVLTGLEFVARMAAVPGRATLLTLLEVVNGLGAAGVWTIWAIGRALCPPDERRWHPLTIAHEVVAWLLSPVTPLLLVTLPWLQALTKMMLGMRLEYRRTPKVVRQGIAP